MNNTRGYFAIGVYNPKTSENIGTLWRHALLFNAAFIYTIGARYKVQASDTSKSHRHIPLYHYADITDFTAHKPQDCAVVFVELGPPALNLSTYEHPERAIYMLGAEDSGIPPEIILNYEHNMAVVKIESPNPQSMNVATAGTLAMYDRYIKTAKGDIE